MAVTVPERFRLGALPTPLQPFDRLSRAVGGVHVLGKRDDLTGFALGGNKVRKLEYLLSDALNRGCDALLTGGGAGSNHCRAAAAAARVAGLECRIVLYGDEPAPPPPNVRLMRCLGASLRFTGDLDRASVDRVLEDLAGELRAAGRRPYLVPRGGATARGAVGYALAAGELAAQAEAIGAHPTAVVVATGSCGTQAGLVAGTVAAGRPWRVVGAAASRPVEECRERVLRLAGECSDLLGWPRPEATDVHVEDALGPGHELPSEAGASAADLALRTEGLLLDHVFTAKAMGVLVSMVEAGERGPVVFVHTGGIPAALQELSTVSVEGGQG